MSSCSTYIVCPNCGGRAGEEYWHRSSSWMYHCDFCRSSGIKMVYYENCMNRYDKGVDPDGYCRHFTINCGSIYVDVEGYATHDLSLDENGKVRSLSCMKPDNFTRTVFEQTVDAYCQNKEDKGEDEKSETKVPVITPDNILTRFFYNRESGIFELSFPESIRDRVLDYYFPQGNLFQTRDGILWWVSSEMADRSTLRDGLTYHNDYWNAVLEETYNSAFRDDGEFDEGLYYQNMASLGVPRDFGGLQSGPVGEGPSDSNFARSMYFKYLDRNNIDKSSITLPDSISPEFTFEEYLDYFHVSQERRKALLDRQVRIALNKDHIDFDEVYRVEADMSVSRRVYSNLYPKYKVKLNAIPDEEWKSVKAKEILESCGI